MSKIPGFKYVIFGAKALIENFVETGTKKHPSKFDFGPINTTITSNYVNGTRFRLSGMTTGNLDPHWSFSGYAAYGTRDKKWFYKGQAAYSFNKREYVLWEFPKHYLAFDYSYDVMSPMDKYLSTDKDNMFVGWKWTKVDQMSYMRDATLTYELETNTGFSIKAMARHRNDQPAGGVLQYWKTMVTSPEYGMIRIPSSRTSPPPNSASLCVTHRVRRMSTRSSAVCPYRWMPRSSLSPTPSV